MRLNEIQAVWHRLLARMSQTLSVAQARARITTRHYLLVARRNVTARRTALETHAESWRAASAARMVRWREAVAAKQKALAAWVTQWRGSDTSARIAAWHQAAMARGGALAVAAALRALTASGKLAALLRSLPPKVDALRGAVAGLRSAAPAASGRLAAKVAELHAAVVAKVVGLRRFLSPKVVGLRRFLPPKAVGLRRFLLQKAAGLRGAVAARYGDLAAKVAPWRGAVAAPAWVAVAWAAVAGAARRLGRRGAGAVRRGAGGLAQRALSALRARVQKRAWTVAGIPDGVRVLVACTFVLTAIVGIGYGVGRMGAGAQEADSVADSVAGRSNPPAPPTPPAIAAVIPAPLDEVPRIVPLSRLVPITGPDRPPLPDDVNGPYGSRLTTGTYEVALTFDDGPDPRWTPAVLELLRLHRVRATFCLIGVNAAAFPDLVRAIAADGHTLCNHSWAHDTGLGSRSHATILSDMARTNEVIRDAVPSARISYFRHPGGAWTQSAVDAARKLGMTSLHWDVDPRDWLRPGPRAIATNVTSSTVPGSIVLLHDGGGDRRGTADALRTILPNLATRFPLVALPPGIDPPRRHGIHLPVHLGQQ